MQQRAVLEDGLFSESQQFLVKRRALQTQLGVPGNCFSCNLLRRETLKDRCGQACTARCGSYGV